jgi:histidine triad (HIT) family protein
MADCVFCRILRRELPCELLLETPTHVAILDVQPVRPGHALVIARPHVQRLAEADPALAGAMLASVLKLAPAILRATGSDGFNLVVNNGPSAGQVVHHLHMHVIPRAAGDGIRFGWTQGRYADGQMAQVGRAVRAALEPAR